MKVLLAGASGAIEIHLTLRLIASGHGVVGLSRTPANYDRLCALGAVAMFACEEDVFFPARKGILPRTNEIFPNLDLSESLEGYRHIPSKAALGRVNERRLAFLAGPDETQSGR